MPRSSRNRKQGFNTADIKRILSQANPDEVLVALKELGIDPVQQEPLEEFLTDIFEKVLRPLQLVGKFARDVRVKAATAIDVIDIFINNDVPDAEQVGEASDVELAAMDLIRTLQEIEFDFQESMKKAKKRAEKIPTLDEFIQGLPIELTEPPSDA